MNDIKHLTGTNYDSIIELLWDSSLYGMSICSYSQELLNSNNTFNSIFGIYNSESYAVLTDIFPDDASEEVFNQFHKLFHDHLNTLRFDIHFKNIRSEEKYLNINFFKLSENQKILVIVEDNSLQKKALLEIQKANNLLEESDRLKAAFLANMSHEIRTPMNGIIGFSGMLLEPDITDEKRKQFVEIIISSSNQLVELIDNIIDFSKIEARHVVINNHEFYLNNLMDEVYAYFEPTAKSKGLNFNYLCGLNMANSKIISDEKRLKQVINNMLSNAFKFTHTGTIDFSYSINGKEILFQFRDTGIGIDPKNFQVIFERFRQADDSSTRIYGGTGLGLSISKSYIELLGGRIWVQSKLNEGSVFSFTIPYHPADSAQIIPDMGVISALPDWSDKTILVAEDEDINYIYIAEVISGTNANLLLARNGLEAVELVRNNGSIDLILMDIKMPELNGYEATKIIKQMNPNIPVIAQTAYAMTGDREIALSEGCDDYIPKPVKKDKLLAILSRYLD